MTQKEQSGTEPNGLNPTPQTFLPKVSEVVISLGGDGDLINARFTITEQMKSPGEIYLKDEATGYVCRTAVLPKMGMVISSRKKPGKVGYCLFRNTEYAIKAGSLVTLVIGGFRKEHLTVII